MHFRVQKTAKSSYCSMYDGNDTVNNIASDEILNRSITW